MGEHPTLRHKKGKVAGKTNVAVTLLCGLAICCSVMYFTAEDEYVLASAPAKSVYGIGGPTSVDSTDVQKAGTVFTNTPDGRMRLTDYLNNVEKEIAAEEAARKRDVAAVRAQMDRNFAFNQAARKKLKKALLHKMAVNAKKAKDDLARAMRFVQGRFHRAAALANRRNRANIRRSKLIRARVARDKAHAAHQLRIAVKAQQRSMAEYKSAINARIAQTNKHVAVNAAQIKEDAKAARKALEGAVSKFDKKVANARAEAAKGRSKLAAQLAAQDKATRQWANNKLKVVVAKTAAHFRRVRAKMAADRHHADMALKSATSRMTASLNAAKALNDKNFAKTVKDIAAAKEEAKARVAAAKTEFKTKINLLRATVKQQVAKTNARITQLSGTVNKNKLEQAKVNANVRAETNRMIKVGNKRYQEHLKKDRELKNLIKSNKAATDARLKAMADHYSTELDKVRSTMKKNRAHASHMLAKETGKLHAAIAKSEKAQMKINGKLAAQTRNARLDIADELRSAKSDFSKRMAALHGNIVRNDKTFEGKMDKLAGIVRANAVKNARGRSQLAAVMKANKMELKAAVQGAVHKGEVRMMKAEQKLKDMNKKTKSSLNMRITSEVSKLAKDSAAQIENLRLSSAKARGEMRRELLYAVRSAAAEAKKNLAAAVKVAKVAFSKANDKERAAARKNAAGRAAIARSIASSKRAAKRQLNDAVGAMNRSLLALKTETAKKIKKSNHKVTAFAGALAMEANMNSLTAKINAARRSAASATRAANAKSAAGFRSALKSVASAMGAAQRRASNKFGKLYRHMAADRARADSALAASVKNINDGIAKQAALADSRAQAAKQVSDARKTFATSIAATVSAVKDQESRLSGEIAVVSGEVARNRAIQLRVNRRTNAELKRITKLSNDRHSASIRARGKLRALLDENKRAASEEVGALNKLFVGKPSKIRRRAAKDRIEAARDLSKASQRLYSKLAGIQLRAAYQNKAATAAINSYSKKSQAAIRIARSSMNARLNTLGNVIASNARKVESGFEVLTGVIRSHRAAGAVDRKLIREQTKAMGQDMQKSIARSIMIGEAKARRVADRARGNLARAKRAMLIEISERVEHTADKFFKTIQGSHQKIADNYLSLKAYAVTAGDKLKDYVIKGKGKNLSSLGDLLTTVAGLSSVKAQKAEGLGAGAKSIPAIFSAKKVKVKAMLTKINGLVNEYTGVINAVRARWPMSLGKYLLLKLEESMLTKGVLQVDKVSNHAGNWVFLNGRAVGLSNKLTAALAGKKH